MIRKKKLRFIALGVIASATFYENAFFDTGYQAHEISVKKSA